MVFECLDVTHSSPGFGGSQSPCATAGVEENPRRPGPHLADCLIAKLFRAEVEEERRRAEEVTFEESARCCVVDGVANDFLEHWKFRRHRFEKPRLAACLADILVRRGGLQEKTADVERWTEVRSRIRCFRKKE